MCFSILLLALVWTSTAANAARDDVSDCQESSPRALCDRLNQLEHRLTEQNHLLQQLQLTLSRQEDLLQRQGSQLSLQNRLLRRQDAKLSEQAKLVKELQAEKARGSEEQRLNASLESDHSEKASDKFHNYPTGSDSKDSVTSVAHDVIARSDDAGPLETVVSQMGQQLTEINADIQAMKNSNNQQMAQVNSDIQSLRNAKHLQDQEIQDAQSSTFVHWGSCQCSNDSQLVYSGVVGGSPYDQSGAAANYLCLTLSPAFVNRQHPVNVAYLYGGEYNTFDSHQEKDPVCAVCRSSHSTTIMIPGTNVCTPGWHQHYSGYLMAGYPTHAAASEFICVDSRFESRIGSNANQNGKLLYFTVTACGGLPCEPYVNDKLVTCVVCSK